MVVIKRATGEDIPHLLEMERRIFLPQERGSEAAFLYRLQAHGWWFRKAIVEEEVSGFFCGRQVSGTALTADLYGCDAFTEGETFVLLDMVVDEKKQGQGLGMLLMKTLRYLCEERGLWRILTACPAEQTGFFIHYGFQPCQPDTAFSPVFGRCAWVKLQLDL